MLDKNFTVGLVIADSDEYVRIDKYLFDDAVAADYEGLVGHVFTVKGKSGDITVKTVVSGIGKVNAAVAATLLAPECDILVNAGLSGGFGDAKKYDIVLGTEFIEHDFDLSPIGYKVAQKPGKSAPIVSAKELNDDIIKKFPLIKSGAFVTGDCFVSSKEKHDFLKESFNPIACDMESAAVGYVAQRLDIPFVSIRMVSDGADDSSADTYSDTLYGNCADGWLKLTFDWLETL